MQRFADRVALITGGSRGIGFAIAQRLVDEGAYVVITGRKQESLDAALAELGPRASAVAGKADDPDHRAEAFAHVAERHGRLDHLVNNAGINPSYGPVLDIDLGLAHKILAVNVLGTLEWTRDAVAAGLTRSVVNLSSISGLSAAPNIAFYGVSKAAIINLTIQLAHELAPGIRVNAVAPAVIKTAFARALYEGREAEVAAGYPLQRLGEPADVAGPVAFLLSDDAAWITGQTVVIDGGGSLTPHRLMKDTNVADDVTRAAVRLFAAQGYANTSVQQIVEAAGVTKGAMYHYFESKDDLLFAIYERMLSLQKSHLDDIIGRGGPVDDVLRAVCVDVVETSIEFLPEGTVFFRSQHMLTQPRQQEVVRRRREYHDEFATLIQRGQGRVSIAPTSRGRCSSRTSSATSTICRTGITPTARRTRRSSPSSSPICS